MLPMPVKKKKKRSFGKGGKDPTINNPDTHHGMYDMPNASVRSYSEKAKPMKFAKGGTVGTYSKMEKEHVAQMKKHGVPEKYVKQEQKEAMGMKRGGMACGGGMKKYARGGGIESKGKGAGTMVRMASGGSVSARADGIASKGKTNCKMR